MISVEGSFNSLQVSSTATVLDLAPPPPRRSPDDGFKGSTECGLVGKPCLKCHVGQGTGRVRQELFRSLDSLVYEVVMRRRAKRLSERSGEMGHGQAAFASEGRQAERAVEMFRE